ncbi:MAG: ABC transporter ATP-binding protein [Culicoidibacterales bacterium]
MIEFQNVSKKFGENLILDDISFTIESGELIVLIGESGSGKTTLLKLINRLIVQTDGNILINAQNTAHQNVIQLRRNLGYVVQKTGLFPHLTVSENIALIMKIEKKGSKAEIKAQVEAVMTLIGLDYDDYFDRYPSELSGGQQQRIEIARALITDPEIILMDEPFSALDPLTRRSLQAEIVQLQKQMQKTIVFVTHDMDEALSIADRICFLENGKMIQIDTPEKMLKQPNSQQVRDFFGEHKIWSYPEFIAVETLANLEVLVSTTLQETAFESYQVVVLPNSCYELYQKNKLTGVYVKQAFEVIPATTTLQQLLTMNAQTYVVIGDEAPVGVIGQAELLSVFKQMQTKEVAK